MLIRLQGQIQDFWKVGSYIFRKVCVCVGGGGGRFTDFISFFLDNL